MLQRLRHGGGRARCGLTPALHGHRNPVASALDLGRGKQVTRLHPDGLLLVRQCGLRQGLLQARREDSDAPQGTDRGETHVDGGVSEIAKEFFLCRQSRSPDPRQDPKAINAHLSALAAALSEYGQPSDDALLVFAACSEAIGMVATDGPGWSEAETRSLFMAVVLQRMLRCLGPLRRENRAMCGRRLAPSCLGATARRLASHVWAV